jgi:hypothetical protein
MLVFKGLTLALLAAVWALPEGFQMLSSWLHPELTGGENLRATSLIWASSRPSC